MTGQRYITKAQLERLNRALKPRHRAVLAAIDRCHLLTGKQLQTLLYENSDSGHRLARLDLAWLTEQRLLTRLDRRIGGVRAGSAGFVYGLDIAGQRLLRPNQRRYRPAWTPRPQHLQHALAVSDLYVRLSTTTIDNPLLSAFDAEPTCWRTFTGPGGSPQILKPDAFVIIDSPDFEDRYFIEVDRATESGTRLTAKAQQYVRYWQSGREQASSDVFPRVLWIVPDARRAEQVVDAMARLPADHWSLFAIATDAEATHQLITGALAEPPAKEIS